MSMRCGVDILMPQDFLLMLTLVVEIFVASVMCRVISPERAEITRPRLPKISMDQ